MSIFYGYYSLLWVPYTTIEFYLHFPSRMNDKSRYHETLEWWRIVHGYLLC